MGVVLRISGKELDPEKLEIDWELEPVGVHIKGKPKFRHTKIEKESDFSQLTFDVSKADFSDLNNQIPDAIQFLKTHTKALRKISKESTVDSIALDFAFNSRIDGEKVYIQHDYFPSELIRLAGRLNMEIWLTQWPNNS